MTPDDRATSDDLTEHRSVGEEERSHQQEEETRVLTAEEVEKRRIKIAGEVLETTSDDLTEHRSVGGEERSHQQEEDARVLTAEEAEERRIKIAGEVLDEQKRIAKQIAEDLRFYKVRQVVIYIILFGAGVLAAIWQESGDKAIVASARQGCERTNVLRVNQAVFLNEEIKATQKILDKPNGLGGLESFRKDVERAQAIKRDALKRARASVGIRREGTRYQVDCKRAHPDQDRLGWISETLDAF